MEVYLVKVTAKCVVTSLVFTNAAWVQFPAGYLILGLSSPPSLGGMQPPDIGLKVDVATVRSYFS